jgi:hypothetical protein
VFIAGGDHDDDGDNDVVDAVDDDNAVNDDRVKMMMMKCMW